MTAAPGLPGAGSSPPWRTGGPARPRTWPRPTPAGGQPTEGMHADDAVGEWAQGMHRGNVHGFAALAWAREPRRVFRACQGTVANGVTSSQLVAPAVDPCVVDAARLRLDSGLRGYGGHLCGKSPQ